MLSKNQLKKIRSLGQKKFRQQFQEFLVEGNKSVSELFSSSIQLQELYAVPSWIETNEKALSSLKGCKVSPVTQKDLDRCSQLHTAPSVLAIAEIPSFNFNPAGLQGRYSLALDGVRDPGNLGTMIRLCDWFGFKHLLCSEDCVEWTNPKVIQASMGSFSRVLIHQVPLESTLDEINLPIYGARMDGQDYRQMSFEGEGILLMGSESHGIRFRGNDEISLAIPGTGYTESLNVGVAAGILMSALFPKT